jgi:integrase
MAQRPKKLRDHVRDAIRLTHDSIRTEASSGTWMRRDMLFQNTRHSNEMAGAAIEELLTHVAVAQQVAASTQN